MPVKRLNAITSLYDFIKVKNHALWTSGLMVSADDERLDQLLENLERKFPDAASDIDCSNPVDSDDTEHANVTGPIADDFVRVHRAIKKLTQHFVHRFGPEL